MQSRWNSNGRDGFHVFSTKEKASASLSILMKMIAAGADVNALDSCGNSCLWRFTLQANQILPQYIYAEHRECDNRVFTTELHEDLRQILTALRDAGADVNYKSPNRGAIRDVFREGSIAVLLKEVFG